MVVMLEDMHLVPIIYSWDTMQEMVEQHLLHLVQVQIILLLESQLLLLSRQDIQTSLSDMKL